MILDQCTKYEIENVQIWKTSRPDILMVTDSSGYFMFTGISGGIFKCPDMQLNFKKDGYKVKTLNFRSYLTDNVLIYLEKDFDFSIIRTEIKDTVIEIGKANYVTSGIVGPGAKTPKIWYTRQWIIEHATTDELLIFINYPNSAVRATVGLYKKGYPGLYDILMDIIDHSNDDLHYTTGCIGD